MGQYTISATNSPSTAGYSRGTCRDSTGKLHSVYRRSDGANLHIYYKNSTNNGKTWGGETQISTGVHDYSVACIAVDSFDNLHVAYHNVTDGNLTYRKWTLLGGWGAQQDLVSSVPAYNAIAVLDDDSILIVYSTGATNWWYWTRSEDGGATWTAEAGQSPGASNPTNISLAADNYGYGHMVYRYGASAIQYCRFDTGTDVWDTLYTALSGVGLYGPDIAVDAADNLLVVYSNGEIYWRTSANQGALWVAEAIIAAWDGNDKTFPGIGCDAAGVYVLVYREVDGSAVGQIWGKTYVGAWGLDAKLTAEVAGVTVPRPTSAAYPATGMFPAGYGYTFFREDGTYVRYDNDSLPNIGGALYVPKNNINLISMGLL